MMNSDTEQFYFWQTREKLFKQFNTNKNKRSPLHEHPPNLYVGLYFLYNV